VINDKIRVFQQYRSKPVNARPGPPAASRAKFSREHGEFQAAQRLCTVKISGPNRTKMFALKRDLTLIAFFG
jgi:hypothetical protein